MVFTRVLTLKILLLTLVLVAVSPFALAQSKVEIRGNDKDDYSRLVFDWPEATNYKISKSGATLSLSFDKSASADSAAVNNTSLKNIGTVSVTADSPLSVTIQIKPESEFRHFKIGKRVMVDVYDAKGEIVKTPVTAQTKLPEGEKEEKTKTAPTQTAEQEAPPAQTELETVIENNPEIQQISGIQPHVVTLTATRASGMAAFERAGFLWLVFDNPDLKVAPLVAGPEKEKFGTFEKIEIENGIAYRLPTPAGYKFYGEGGGLQWRLVMTPNPRAVKTMEPVAEGQGASAMLNFPMAGARKNLKITDPLLGDEIQVVTASDASDVGGEARRYVEFETLPSFVGAAFLSKVDDLTTKISTTGVAVTRPKGLSVSAIRDTQAAVLKNDIQKEKEFFENEENPNRLSGVFDFARWEMGGLTALEKNRQIIMRGVGAKQGSYKVEDLITLAKLNVANDRGHEALGLLRVAEQELPGIQDNAEFIALRGAAETLAGKFDEAIRNLKNPSVQQFGEIGYWKAAALAGLEDWQQADSVMPSDLRLLEEYPVQIQQPLILKLIEVALRAGKTAEARDLLEILEPEFPQMSFARQSAWKYLNGELERQNGKPDKAAENWETLITGRDDYYRAKAGLSLTRLQLERKKITPEKAIDRLEGLRYAWRGDELETLVNYRLGEVYINNEDYLKGLSVLRNAVSLSPDSPISKEVTDYMTETFRSLFTDGKLKDMSPLDAVSIYDEFKELTPIGKEGDIFVQELAERLVDVDLLGRASALLEHQLNHRLEGESAAKVAIRLAAIRLLDNKPESALLSLEVAQNKLSAATDIGAQDAAFKRREINLLKARALSKVGRANEGLDLLAGMAEDANLIRLRADIAWNAGRWAEAAKAFEGLIAIENISKTRPPNEYQTGLILNRSIALNLSGNRSALDTMRTRYGDLMAQSDKAKIFDLITRPRQLGMVGDDSSITSLISEVDLFGDFLESYKKTN